MPEEISKKTSNKNNSLQIFGTSPGYKTMFLSYYLGSSSKNKHRHNRMVIVSMVAIAISEIIEPMPAMLSLTSSMF